MILTCPQCTTRFLLQASTLLPDGRRVKCSNCGEIWFQEPDPAELEDVTKEDTGQQEEWDDWEEASKESVEEESKDKKDGEEEEDAAGDEDSEEGEDGDGDSSEPSEPYYVDDPDEKKEEAFEPIPAAVIPEEFDHQEIPESASIALIKKIVGTGVMAACLFGLSFGVLVMMKDGLVKSWPASMAMYDLFGISTRSIGDGIVFDRVMATYKDDVIKVKGTVINLTPEGQTVPFIEAQLRDRYGKTLEKWPITLDEYELGPEADTEFSALFKTEHNDAEGVLVSFVLNEPEAIPESKIASEDDHSIAAPFQDDHALQNGDVKALKLPERVSAPHH